MWLLKVRWPISSHRAPTFKLAKQVKCLYTHTQNSYKLHIKRSYSSLNVIKNTFQCLYAAKYSFYSWRLKKYIKFFFIIVKCAHWLSCSSCSWFCIHQVLGHQPDAQGLCTWHCIISFAKHKKKTTNSSKQIEPETWEHHKVVRLENRLLVLLCTGLH